MISYLKLINFISPDGEELRQYIHDNCIDIEEEGFDYESGYGRFVLSDDIEFNKYFVMEKDEIPMIIKMDLPAQIIDGRSCIPTHFIAEATGGVADWNEETGTFIIGNKIIKVTKDRKELIVAEV